MNTQQATLRTAFATMRRDVAPLPEPMVEQGRVWLREVSALSNRMVRENYQPEPFEVDDLMDWCNEFRHDVGLDPIQA